MRPVQTGGAAHSPGEGQNGDVSGAARPEGVHVLGLRYDGKLVAAGNNDYAQCQVR